MRTDNTSYDDLPYPSYPFELTHPDHLATVAWLFGLTTPEVSKARVLELGCASGGNLLPMAAVLPEARFVGIDLSSEQIGAGNFIVEQIGLKNIELRQADILALGAELGKFDYIICHGVYSWVPAPVRTKILDLCSELLSPNGVAMVSYNTYPGWHSRGMIREMLRFHASRFQDIPQKVRQARALLQFLADTVSGAENPFAMILKNELADLQRRPDGYLYHEQLEEVNDPCYFHEFASAVAASRLQYLGDAELRSMSIVGYPQTVRETLSRVAGSLIEQEQYLDFLRNRTFRQSILCHANIQLQHGTPVTRLLPLHLRSHVKRVSDGPQEISAVYEAHGAGRLRTSDRVVQLALETLAMHWPHSASWAELYENVAEQCDSTPQSTDAMPSNLSEFCLRMMHCVIAGFINIRLSPDRYTCEVGQRVRATSLARYQAANMPYVASLRHDAVKLDWLDLHVLCLADGNHTLNELAKALIAKLRHSDDETDRKFKDNHLVSEDHMIMSITASLERLRRYPLLLPE